MKILYRSLTLFSIIILTGTLVIISCEKLDLKKFVSVRTLIPEDIEDHSVKGVGFIDDLGDETITDHGFFYAKHSNPTQSDSVVSLGKPLVTGKFTALIDGLDKDSKYFIRAFISDGEKFWYNEEILFSTSGTVFLPDVQTAPVTEITASTAKTGGVVTADGGAPVKSRGICFGTKAEPDTSGNLIMAGSGNGEFMALLNGLKTDSTYFIRAYAINSKGIAYGNEVMFVAGQQVNVPVVVTADISEITSINAVSGGTVLSDGGSPVTSRGVCWSQMPEPTVNDSKTTDGSGPGEFSSTITNLVPGTSYFLRAYAANEIGISYGETKSFTTGGNSPNGEWLHYDNGTNYDGIGLNSGGSFDVAIRFDPSQLADYEGWSIVRIRFFPKGAFTDYAVEGFTGQDPNPATPVFYHEVINPEIDEWNEVILENPHPINVNTDLWVGYYCIGQPVGEYPAGVDTGPSTPYYSDLIFAGGQWNSMAAIGLNLNWNIRVFIENIDGETKEISLPVKKAPQPETNQEQILSPVQIISKSNMNNNQPTQ